MLMLRAIEDVRCVLFGMRDLLRLREEGSLFLLKEAKGSALSNVERELRSGGEPFQNLKSHDQNSNMCSTWHKRSYGRLFPEFTQNCVTFSGSFQ